MGKYQKGEHVKVEVLEEESGESEWMWLLVDHGDDEQRLVFGDKSAPEFLQSVSRF